MARGRSLSSAFLHSAPPTYKHHRHACAWCIATSVAGLCTPAPPFTGPPAPPRLTCAEPRTRLLNHEHAQPLRSGAGGTASARCLTPRMHQNSGLDSLLSRTRTRNATCRNMQYGTVPSSTVLSKNAIWTKSPALWTAVGCILRSHPSHDVAEPELDVHRVGRRPTQECRTDLRAPRPSTLIPLCAV